MMRKHLPAILLIGLFFSCQGCIVVEVADAGLKAAGGTIAYVTGNLQAEEHESIDVVYEAALKALEELELTVTSKSKDALAAEINACDAKDKKTVIKLRTSNIEDPDSADTTTRVSIRVGFFGSETSSRSIHEKIRENLREMREGI